MPIEQRLYIGRDLRIGGTSTGLTCPARNGCRACCRERNRQWNSESQLYTGHFVSPLSGERKCRRDRKRVTSEQFLPIASASHGISLVTDTRSVVLEHAVYATHGSTTSVPQSSKSFALRVARLAPR